MHKAKSNRSLAKRFKLTARGKLLRMKQGRKHILTKKSAKRKRSLAKATLVADSFLLKFKRMMRGL